MCDTMVALANSTADGSVIFAKNSDREPNEAHYLTLIPHAQHQPQDTVKCTYIEIPQVAETNAILLAKPFWIWGAEMGANEHGVVIGNEALFSKVPVNKGPGLIGMDYLRLALERASNARMALDIIVQLLAIYNQAGNCGFQHSMYYHNSYLIADTSEAWVLETVGKQWAAEKVESIRTISNLITIGRHWDLASEGLVDQAVERGWCKDRHDFDFSRCYSDAIYTRFGQGRKRQCRTTQLLAAGPGKVDLRAAMSILRDHGENGGSDWTPAKSIASVNVCMHAGFGPIRINQTTGSMVSHIKPGSISHWFTGTSAPCTGVFKPVWIDGGLPEQGLIPSGHFDPDSSWWRHELLHRATLRDYAHRMDVFQGERDQLEADFIEAAGRCDFATAEERARFSEACFSRASEATQHWTQQVKSLPVSQNIPLLYANAWHKFNQTGQVD